jgi:hypothetical protein
MGIKKERRENWENGWIFFYTNGLFLESTKSWGLMDVWIYQNCKYI